MRVRACLAGLVAAGVLGACASVPTTGPVRPGPEVAPDVDDSVVRVLAPPPRAGASPEEIVRGFLLASPSFESDQSQARLFLSAAAAREWRPDTGVRVYDSDSFSIDATSDEVRVQVRQVASIDAEGRYHPLPDPVPTTADFGVTRVDGEWRIATLDSGLLLTSFDVSRAYREVQVYFLDPERSIVVPDLLLLPNRPNLATALTNRLLRGPTTWLAPGVTTAFPAGTALDVASVPVVDGVAQVDMTEAALTADAADRQAMAAQLTWTLRQIPQVRFVRMRVNDREFPVPGVTSEQSRESWPTFDPGGLGTDASAYAVQAGRLGALDATTFEPVAGPAGDGTLLLEDPAIALGGDAVAGLSENRRRLHRGPLTEDAGLPVVLEGGDLSGPSWDPSGSVWTVDRATGTLHVVLPDDTSLPIAVEGIEPGSLLDVRLSRDGTRALVLSAGAEHELLVGVVGRTPDGGLPARLSGLTRIAPELTDVRDLVWADGSRITALAVSADGELRPVTVGISGYSILPLGPIDAVTVAAAPGSRPTFAATAVPELFAAAGRDWTPVGSFSSPLYPG